MQNVFDSIFRSIREHAEKNLSDDKADTLLKSETPVSVLEQGSIPFDFQLDASGNYVFQAEQYGAGVTVSADAEILGPPATYDVVVTSSDGGGGSWNGVGVGDVMKFQIKTSFWRKTKITVKLHASLSNQSGNGKITYSY